MNSLQGPTRRSDKLQTRLSLHGRLRSLMTPRFPHIPTLCYDQHSSRVRLTGNLRPVSNKTLREVNAQITTVSTTIGGQYHSA